MKVYLSEQEYNAVLESSQKAGLSLSEFVRRVTQGARIQSLESQQAIRDLMKVNADLARLGGLFKQALAQGHNRELVYGFFHKIDGVLADLKAKIMQL